MDFLKRLFSPSSVGASQRASSPGAEAVSSMPALRPSQLDAFGNEIAQMSAVELDIEALIVSHERWLPWLWQALEGQVDEQLRPHVIRDARSSELGAWLHDAGHRALGHLPTYEMLLVRNRYFHTKAADLIMQVEQGDFGRADQTFKQCQHASRQMVLLLKELKRGLARGGAASGPAPLSPLSARA